MRVGFHSSAALNNMLTPKISFSNTENGLKNLEKTAGSQRIMKLTIILP
jgi:hypothetical protein